MLQQTRVETVVPYYRNFLRRFPTLKRLAAAPLQDVLKAWEGLGYYSRARNLWRAARLVVENFHGRIPVEYDRFRELPGVGDYIAAAVLSIGRGLAVPVVDGNVLRVVCRWQGIASDIRLAATRETVRSFLQRVIPADDPGRFNEALMELGALVCLPKNPLCRQCPLRAGCFAFRHGKTGSLPVKSRKKSGADISRGAGRDPARGKVFIQQRPENGHLGGLWEFPGGKCRAGEEPEAAVVRECREELGDRGRAPGQAGRGAPRLFPFQGHPARVHLPDAGRPHPLPAAARLGRKFTILSELSVPGREPQDLSTAEGLILKSIPQNFPTAY